MSNILLVGIIILSLGRYIGIKGTKEISVSIIIIINMLLLLLLKDLGKESGITRIKEWVNIGQIREELTISKGYEIILMYKLIIIISSVVIIYSYWYQEEEPMIIRFIGLLWIFSCSMLKLVTSSSYLDMYIGWELVGITSSLLINYWYGNENSRKSGIKALIYNKIGDISILSMITIMIIGINNTRYINIKNINKEEINMIIILIIIGVIAKSSQFFLYNWLGDAMAGPTPVSALLHAATMVTAGIYILIRTIKNMEEIEILKEIKIIIEILGLMTIIIGGIIGINEYDIKKIIAYSTASQLAYMYIGTLIVDPMIGLYHLITHGYFKALLFLSAGIIIHKIVLEQDIRRYGILEKLPAMSLLILISSLSLSALPLLSGYNSKEEIIKGSIINTNISIYIILLIGSVLTVLYSLRLFKYTFMSFPSHTISIIQKEKGGNKES